MNQGKSSDGANRIYNLITALMLVLTALTLLAVIGVAVFFAPNTPPGVSQAQPPTLIPFPLTNTPTLEGPTPNASWTPSPSPTITDTPTPSRTPVPTQTNTPTNTSTATKTNTPTVTPPPTNTLSPSITPTRGPFDFVLRDGVVTYTQYNLTPGVGCGWGGMGGAVYDKYGVLLTSIALLVHVNGPPNVNDNFPVGAHPEYGASGWEFFITNTPVSRTYDVRLVYADGAIASDGYQITTGKGCEKNLTVVNFIQVQDRATH